MAAMFAEYVLLFAVFGVVLSSVYFEWQSARTTRATRAREHDHLGGLVELFDGVMGCAHGVGRTGWPLLNRVTTYAPSGWTTPT